MNPHIPKSRYDLNMYHGMLVHNPFDFDADQVSSWPLRMRLEDFVLSCLLQW
jgi:hypothetical protein